MARVKTTKSKHSESCSLIEDYYRNGKWASRIVEYISDNKKVFGLVSKENIDVKIWLDNYKSKYNKEYGIYIDYEKVM